MNKFEFNAILDIRISIDADTQEEALAKAIESGDYDIIGSRLADTQPTKYISTAEYAKRHGYASNIYVSKLCAQGAIPGVIRIGNSYGIPEGTPKIDRRVTSGKYRDWYAKYGRKRYEKQKAEKEQEK